VRSRETGVGRQSKSGRGLRSRVELEHAEVRVGISKSPLLGALCVLCERHFRIRKHIARALVPTPRLSYFPTRSSILRAAHQELVPAFRTQQVRADLCHLCRRYRLRKRRQLTLTAQYQGGIGLDVQIARARALSTQSRKLMESPRQPAWHFGMIGAATAARKITTP